MCGIVGALGARNIVPILIQGLQRLEYRGYDSCGVAVHDGSGLQRARSTQRVSELAEQVRAEHIQATLGIAHTRWATHGAPAVHNAHPHFSHGTGADAEARAPGRIALVHNGIIENHDELRAELQARYPDATFNDTGRTLAGEELLGAASPPGGVGDASEGDGPADQVAEAAPVPDGGAGLVMDRDDDRDVGKRLRVHGAS